MLDFSFSRSDLKGADDDDDNDSGRREDWAESDFAEAAYEVIQDEVKGAIYAIKAKAVLTERRIDSMAKRMSTADKNMVEIKRNQVTMTKIWWQ